MIPEESALDRILAATVPGGLAVSQAVRRSILRAIRENRWRSPNEVLAAIREVLRISNPMLADAFRDSLLTAYIGAAHATAKEAYAEEHDPTPSILDSLKVPTTLPPSPRPPVLQKAHLEFTDRGFAWLSDRKLVTSDGYRNADAAARHQAEVIAHATTEQTAKKLTEALRISLEESGGTLKGFQKRANEAMGDSPLAPWQTETLYRTNGGRAFAAGQLHALAQPLVGSEFPYVLYSATHDERTRPTHLMLETLGLDGTAVYRADDPVIRMFWPPWAWNCRCLAVPISIADAASYGVMEAKRWLATGRAPGMPQYVAPPPFGLPPGWNPVTSHFPTVIP